MKRLLLALILVSSSCSTASSNRDREAATLAVIPDSDQWTLKSQVANRTYQVQVSFPRGYDSDSARYEAVYLLDANGQFGITTEIVRNLAYFDGDSPGLIVVGVGYPVGQFYNALGPRSLDLTPNRDTLWAADLAQDISAQSPIETGGAARFLGFLQEELIPRIETEYSVDPSTRTLIGHSLGGLFALYAMIEEPEVFQQYVVISPSTWWDCMEDFLVCQRDTSAPDGWVLRREEERQAQGAALSGRLFLTVGSEELPVMIDGPRRLVARLEERSYPDLDWTFEFVPGEWHMSIVPGAISAGLRWLHFGGPG